MLKVIFVTQDDPFYLPYFFQEFDRAVASEPNISVEGVIIQEPLGSRSFKGLIQRMYDFYGPVGFVITGFRYVWRKVMNAIALKCFGGKFPGAFSVEHYLRKTGTTIIRNRNINNKQFVKSIEEMQVDLILSVGASQKFKTPILNAPKYGCINIHNSKLPKNRGMLPTFWAMLQYEEDPTSAMTIFKMNEDWDAGDIVIQEAFKIDPKQSLDSLIMEIKKRNGPLLVEAIKKYFNGEPDLLPNDDTKATYFTWPDKAAIREFRKKGLKLL